jgi:hypothetical protein
MSEGPVVDARRLQVTDRAGRVVGSALEPADVGVEQADREGRRGVAAELASQVGRDVALVVADPVDAGDLLAVPDYWHRGDIPRRESVRELGPGDRRLPAVERVVVAGHHERGDPAIRKASEPVAEGQLPAQGPVRVLERVPGDQEEVDLLGESEINDVVPSADGRLAERLSDARWRVVGQPDERAIEVQVAGVDEPERHGPPLRDA